ncbi:MAG: hypothetical protein DCF15_09850 [Phormidesmis priestleyi]|uniref:Peptidase C-terminal archaeal/bacterial domain-containing protein n=1 Tax=Phormidesmis priestleyi TaxID=268141 RepID=A0A2W4XES8_9CYAN|nr:MAG: hypothetical protein DCF15_09850 [Phormidesmis priestleyi]
MRLSTYQRCASILLIAALAGCKSLPQSPPANRANPTATEPAAPDQTAGSSDKTDGDQTAAGSKDTPKPIAPALQPGQYCYQLSDDIEDIDVRISIDSASSVTGNQVGVVHNQKEAYYTSYRSNLNGTIDGSNLNLDIATWIEYDKQNQQETWKVSPTELRTKTNKLTKANCETVSKSFQSDNGMEAKDLTAGANQVNTQEVFFDAGKSSTTVSNSVVRGDRDRYLITAQGGQQMDLSITSIENNAVFAVVAPSGLILGTEQSKQSIPLPDTGEYQIIVDGTRGNATYDLAIAIQ